MLIPLSEVLQIIDLPLKGILHIGAHKGEEALVYNQNRIKNILWFEGNPGLIKALRANTSIYNGNYVYQALLSDKDDENVSFNITSNTLSSSLLDLNDHKVYHPQVKFSHSIRLKTYRFDSFVSNHSIDITNYNFVNLDIQGSELYVLKGFGDLLDKIDYIYTEINVANLYKHCSLLHSLDIFLYQQGFIRKKIKMTSWGWGDALFCRESSNTLFVINLLHALFLEFFYKIKTLYKRIHFLYKEVKSKSKQYIKNVLKM